MSWSLKDILALSVHKAGKTSVQLDMDLHEDYLAKVDRQPLSMLDKVVAFFPIALSIAVLFLLLWVTS